MLIAPGGACSSDVDTTGYAVQALSLQPASQTAVARGWEYLRGAQSADGGWSGAAGVNSNSTGLGTQAVLALLEKGGYVGTGAAPTVAKAAVAAVVGGSTPAGSVNGAQAAYRFLEARQRADGGFDVSTTEAGDEGTRTRATTQAVPALAGASLTTLIDPVTPVDPPTAPPSSTTSSTSTTTTPPASTTTGTTTGTTTSTTSPSTSSTTPASTGTSPTPTGGSTPAGTAAASGLASTGTPAGLLVVVAVLLLLGGLVLLLARRLSIGGQRR